MYCQTREQFRRWGRLASIANILARTTHVTNSSRPAWCIEHHYHAIRLAAVPNKRQYRQANFSFGRIALPKGVWLARKARFMEVSRY
jgi:hypothetical protein